MPLHPLGPAQYEQCHRPQGWHKTTGEGSAEHACLTKTSEVSYGSG